MRLDIYNTGRVDSRLPYVFLSPFCFYVGGWSWRLGGSFLGCVNEKECGKGEQWALKELRDRSAHVSPTLERRGLLW